MLFSRFRKLLHIICRIFLVHENKVEMNRYLTNSICQHQWATCKMHSTQVSPLHDITPEYPPFSSLVRCHFSSFVGIFPLFSSSLPDQLSWGPEFSEILRRIFFQLEVAEFHQDTCPVYIKQYEYLCY